MNIKHLAFGVAIIVSITSYGQINQSDTLLKQFKNALSANAPEDSLSKLAYDYSKSVKSQSAYDSMNQQIIAIYPNGNAAAVGALKKMYGKAKSENLSINELNKLKTDFPNAEFDRVGTMAGAYYEAIIDMVFPSFMEKDSSSAVALIPSMNYNALNSAAWNFAETNRHLPTAEAMCKLSLDKIQAALADSLKMSEKERLLLINTQGANEDTYAYILTKLGKKKEALKYEELAIAKINDDLDMNTRYLTLLNDNENYTKALEVAPKIYIEKSGDQKMLDQIMIAYKKVNPFKSFDDYEINLKSQKKSATNAVFAKEMINKTASNFTLKDLNGNNVSLNDYYGKVVIIDFWATWCGPCKMSFPGMQLAINKYKDNPNVVFLFVDTWENTNPKETQEAVSQLMKNEKYSFHVLLDPRREVSNSFNDSYGIDGIPTKFFIDKEGKVQFKEVGFAGSDERVLENVCDRVDFLLGNKS